MYMKKLFLCIGSCMLFAIFLLFTNHFYQPKPRSTPVFAQTEKTVALTFDDGPSDSTTPYVLDILKAENVHATFFLIGTQIPKRQAIVRRIVEEGHSIGIHSNTHRYHEIYQSEQALLKDIEDCKNTIFSCVGFSPDLYRFPGGSFSLSSNLTALVSAQGYTYYDWNASCGDSEGKNKTAEELYHSAVTTSKNKNNVILLCHDFKNNKALLSALPKIIGYYKEKGYRFVAL